MYGHKYHVFLLGHVQPFAPMRDMTFNSAGEALRTARTMFPHLSDSFTAC